MNVLFTFPLVEKHKSCVFFGCEVLMERTISRKRIGSNIKALAKWYDCKISEIEKEAGVSPGYLSRLEKNSEGESSPMIDLLLTASDKFKVPIDSLVSLEFTEIANPDKMRLHSFLETMLYLSNRRELEWYRTTEKGIAEKDVISGFQSDFGDKKEISFFIFMLGEDEYYEEPGFSFFIKNKGVVSKVLELNLSGSPLYEILDKLFESAASFSEVAEIDESADSAISFFMAHNKLLVDPSAVHQKYRPLYNYFMQQTDDVVHLTFREMEDILGFPLPASFRRYAASWANNANGQHQHCKAWLDAGYMTIDVSKNMLDEHMFFKKKKNN